MYSFFRSWCWRLLNTEQPTPSYELFRVAWEAYIGLVTISDKLFICPCCKEKPEVVVCDGITLSFPKKFQHKSKKLAATELPSGSR